MKLIHGMERKLGITEPSQSVVAAFYMLVGRS